MRLWDLGVMRRESHRGGAARAVAEGAGMGPPSPGQLQPLVGAPAVGRAGW